ncbi:MAG: PilZ domain-containing protein [Gammaproteobacteria bacterium]|nr:PilZ domain-containing protein [Gammaproteobacteria bacterium]
MTDKQDTNDERRRFFRIDDEVCLHYDKITENEYANAPAELTTLKQSGFALSADFATLNSEYNPILNSIRQTSAEIAQYFDLINRKLDALSQHLLEEEIPCPESDLRKVNISASGLAFESDEELADNQPLRIRLVLLPEKIGILVFGRVNHCRTPETNNLICIDFEHIRYDDQELMIKHNLNKQMQELRQRSENIQD